MEEDDHRRGAEPGVHTAYGEKLILPRALTGASNLRTTFTKIIMRAGHEPWPRLFQNLRASCATDWVEKYPNHVVAKWLGHSPLIAATHYLQARERHFEDVVAGGGQGTPGRAKAANHREPRQTAVMGDIGTALFEETSENIHPASASGAESGADSPAPPFFLNLGLGPEWASLSEATRAAICELPAAALRELADLTAAPPGRTFSSP